MILLHRRRDTRAPTVDADTAVQPDGNLAASRRLESVLAAIIVTWADRFGRFSMRCLQVGIVAGLLAGALWLIGQLRLVVIPVVLALLLAAAFSPLVQLLRRWHFPRLLAALSSLLLGGGAVAAVVLIVVFRVQNDWTSVISAANQGFAQLQELLASGSLPIDQSTLSGYRQDVVSYLTSAQFGGSALAGLHAAADVITSTLVLIITTFFLLKDGDRISGFLTQPLNESRRARAYRVGTAGLHSLGGYVRGTALVALVDAVLIGGSLLVLKVPLAIALGVVVFIGAFIPIIGATAAGTLAALVSLVTNGLGTAITVAVIILIVNQLEAHILQPLIMGRSVRLYPLVILLTLIFGSISAGIIGAIVAVPVTAVVWDAIKLWNAPEAST